MTHAELRSLALAVLAAFIAILLFSGCETTTTTSNRALPTYESPLAKNNFQNVRTTAYTHTEADHRAFSNRNALGGELHAAGPAIRRAENVRQARAISTDNDDTDVINISSGDAKLEKFSIDKPKKATRVTTTVTTTRAAKTTKSPVITRGGKRAVAVSSKPPRIGSAAADWSRWPVGTTFRLLSTGQMYRVEDYGWALSGRNTIDLYMSNRSDMNSWGARQEPIQIMHWGDAQQSLQILQSHTEHKHIKRMVLELEGRNEEAAALQ